MKVNLAIRDARPGDGEGCARAWSDAGRYVHELNPDVGHIPDTLGLVEWFEQSLAQDREPNHIFMVAESGSRVVGFIYATVEPLSTDARWQIQRDLETPRLVINALAVEEDQRRSGVGTALMQAAEGRGLGQGAVVALTDTNIRSHLSLPFYENRMGYERRAVVLRKALRSEH